jgi:hypothetical protein
VTPEEKADALARVKHSQDHRATGGEVSRCRMSGDLCPAGVREADALGQVGGGW